MFVFKKSDQGSGYAKVGRGVASDTRDPQFKSQHRQKFICQLYNIEKTKIEEKEAVIGPFKKCYSKLIRVYFVLP